MSTDIKVRGRDREVIDCACVIHGDAYDWIYVDRLYSMLQRNLSREVKLHVFTEHRRKVPGHYIKHELQDWPGITGPRKGWWYKMQMFDPARISTRLLYFDLDVVIASNIDWIWQQSDRYFWAAKDFKHLWRPNWTGINSSIMLWDTQQYGWIWDKFLEQGLDYITRRYHGDQDFLSAMLDQRHLRYFPEKRIQSWRWQILDGGMDMKTRTYRRPGSGATLDPDISVAIFHGKPKPHEIQDPLIQQHWV